MSRPHGLRTCCIGYKLCVAGGDGARLLQRAYRPLIGMKDKETMTFSRTEVRLAPSPQSRGAGMALQRSLESLRYETGRFWIRHVERNRRR